MTTTQHRERLPNRRIGETFEVEVAGLRYTATGADVETIRRALCRDSHGHASGPLGVVLDRLADNDKHPDN
jgi:hypothetical protein